MSRCRPANAESESEPAPPLLTVPDGPEAAVEAEPAPPECESEGKWLTAAARTRAQTAECTAPARRNVKRASAECRARIRISSAAALGEAASARAVCSMRLRISAVGCGGEDVSVSECAQSTVLGDHQMSHDVRSSVHPHSPARLLGDPGHPLLPALWPRPRGRDHVAAPREGPPPTHAACRPCTLRPPRRPTAPTPPPRQTAATRTRTRSATRSSWRGKAVAGGRHGWYPRRAS